MKLYKKDVMTILKVLKHQWDTMLEMEEQNYENNKIYGFAAGAVSRKMGSLDT